MPKLIEKMLAGNHFLTLVLKIPTILKLAKKPVFDILDLKFTLINLALKCTPIYQYTFE